MFASIAFFVSSGDIPRRMIGKSLETLLDSVYYV